jgi:hypothetical protein
MANSMVKVGSSIMITFDGTTSWDVTTYLPEYLATGLWVRSLHAKGTAADDLLVVRNAPVVNVTGPKVFDHKFTAAYDTRDRFFSEHGSHMWPSIHSDEVTSSGQTLTIELA